MQREWNRARFCCCFKFNLSHEIHNNHKRNQMRLLLSILLSLLCVSAFPSVLLMMGSLPDEALVLRKSSEHVSKLQERMIVQLPPVSTSKERRMDREKTVINLYAAGHPIEEVWKASGFRSRSSVFRILNKHGIKLNRGKHSGPIKKKDERKSTQDNNE